MHSRIENGDIMVVMDNEDRDMLVSLDAEVLTASKQERVVRLARLAMLVECEGHITIGMTPPTVTRNRPALTPTLGVTNTAIEIVGEAQETLMAEGLAFGARPERPCAGLGRKLRYDLYLHGRIRVEPALKVLLPFLRSKKQQAELVLEFIESRKSADQKAAYSEREWQITTEVRLLNHCKPRIKALAKAKAYLDSPTDPNRARTAEYFRKYIEMCTTLQEAL